MGSQEYTYDYQYGYIEAYNNLTVNGSYTDDGSYPSHDYDYAYEDLEGIEDFESFEKICSYTLLCIIILGVLGNSVTFVVFHKGKKCSVSWCALYFKVLAISDIYVLLTSALRQVFIGISWKLDFYRVHESLCVYGWFNETFCIQVSTWITVAITVDRVICITFPMKFRQLTTAKWVYTKIALTVAVSMAFNVIKAVQADLYTADGVIYCEVVDLPYMYDILNFGVTIFILPAIINTVCNAILLRALYGRATKRVGLTESHVSSRLMAANYATYRVVAIGVIHFLSTLPKTVILGIEAVSESPDTEFEMDFVTGLYLYNLAHVFLYLSSGLNFIFYFITGLDFRRDLKIMVRQVHSSQVDMTSET